jgi:hypothetical protein
MPLDSRDKPGNDSILEEESELTLSTRENSEKTPNGKR